MIISVEFMLLIQFIFFLITDFWIMRTDMFFGIFYLFVYLYGLPAQIGYWYFPELSQVLSAYFGEELWFDYYYFILFSMISFFLLFYLFRDFLISRSLGYVYAKASFDFDFRIIAFAYIILSLLFQVSCMLIYFSDISWSSIADEVFMDSHLFLKIAVRLFKLSVASNLVLYCIWRNRCTDSLVSLGIRILLIPSFAFFLFFATKLGNRTDILALIFGIIIFEIIARRTSLKKISTIVLISLIILTTIESFRYEDTNARVEYDFLPKILMQDYYAPAHVLFTAMNYKFVDPVEVLLSNAANSLIMLDYPLLQLPVLDLILPNTMTRSSSYAFYTFSEGYLFMGYYGFIYNGIVLILLLTLWRSLAKTNDSEFNEVMLPLLSTMIVNLVRGQSSYFIKYLYTFVIPGIILYLMLRHKGWSLRKPS